MNKLPAEEEWEQYTSEASVNYVKSLIDLLETIWNHQESETRIKDLKEILSRLTSSYFAYSDDELKEICEKVINLEKTIVNFKKMFEFHVHKSLIDFDTIENLYHSLVNFTDFASTLCRKLLKFNVIEVLTDDCLNQKETELNDDNPKLTYLLSIMSNVLRDAGNNMNYKFEQFRDLLIEIVKRNGSSKIGLLSTLILAYTLDEKNSEMMNVGSKSIGVLLSMISTANEADLRMKGFTVREMLNGLRWLVVSDAMKLEFVREGGLKTVTDLLQLDVEIESCLGIILHLSFNSGILAQLSDDFKIEAELDRVRSNCGDNEDIHNLCEGIVFRLHGRQTSHQRSSVTVAASMPDINKYDIFLSYSWDNKEEIMKIRAQLEERQYRVWLDTDQLRGSVYEAMATGIEQSRLVLIAASRAYRSSANCHLEADYAMRLRKVIIPIILEERYQPSGWLGIIIGAKLYFEFSARRNSHDTMQQLQQAIRRELEGEVPPASKKEEATGKSNKGARSWSTSHVTQWFQAQGLSCLAKKCTELDGSLLAVMLDMRRSAPEFFNTAMRHDYKMKLPDLLRLHRALNDLDI